MSLILAECALELDRGEFEENAAEFERANYAMSADLPEMADPAALAASLENGILTVTIKKRPETQPRKIEIR